ncbi:MAG: hypothetical protein K0R14_312 [Burkholderiales bacterium]|jgi:glyoxylase I family protein|nr:hypothetical protein [Burkholderiales bacterium]
MLFFGIHHIAIICSDYGVSKRFYTEVLGFKVIRESYREHRNSYKLDLEVDRYTQIELFSFDSPPSRPSNPEACGLRHLAFRVNNIDFVIDHLRENDIVCESLRIDEYTGKRYTFFRDPDNLPLELYEEALP